VTADKTLAVVPCNLHSFFESSRHIRERVNVGTLDSLKIEFKRAGA
jgi:hypothetical protein